MDNTFNPSAEILLEEAPQQKFPWLNVVLFVLTCLTPMVTGTFLMTSFNNTFTGLSGLFREVFRSPSILANGLPFSVAIMSILLAHEMGHYLTCRYYGIDATLPYFIPAPTLVGTMGAFIRIKSPIQHRAALLEVGIAGPIAGFVLAIPTLIIALRKSGFTAIDPAASSVMLGEPLIFKAMEFITGKIPPAGMDINLHPIGFAAWFGFFATALNLLPVGQLDGGHVSYALFRGIHRRISEAFVFTLIPLGIFYWRGSGFWSGRFFLIWLRRALSIQSFPALSGRSLLLVSVRPVTVAPLFFAPSCFL